MNVARPGSMPARTSRGGCPDPGPIPSREAAARPTVWRADAIDRLGECLLARRRGIRARLEQSFRRSSRSRSTSSAGNVGWCTISARSSSAGSSRAAGTSTPADVASQLASAWRLAPRRSEASTSSIGVVAIGALGAGPARRGSWRRPLRGSSTAPCWRTSAALTQRPAGQMGRDEGEAVGEPDAFERREVVGPRNARRRARVDHGAGHAALSTSCGCAVVASASSPASRVLGARRPGDSACTSGRRGSRAGTRAATSRICSAVTER